MVGGSSPCHLQAEVIGVKYNMEFDMQTKQCTKCNKIKILSEYTKDKKSKDGLKYYCKKCSIENVKKYYLSHKEHVRKYKAKYQIKNKERLNEICRKNHQDNKKERNHKAKIYRKNNLDKLSIARKKYNQTDRAKELKRLSHQRDRSTIHGKLRHMLSRRLWHALKGSYKNSSTIEYLGCTIGELKFYLEGQFTTGMSWDNYGSWHLDHAKPCASFDLSKESQIKKCFHYSNLQPLWANKNLSKGAKVS